MNAGKFLKYLILVVVAGNLALAGYVFLGARPTKPIPPTYPYATGYEDLLRAGQMLTENNYNFRKLSHDELSSLVSQNAKALKLAEAGLNRECRVYIDHLPGFQLKASIDGRAMFLLANGFCARGKLAALEHRTNEAVESYLQSFRLGDKSSRGGFIASKNTALTCEYFGREGLLQWTNSLDALQSLKVAQTLETLDAQEEPVEEFLRQQRIMVHEATSLWEQMKAIPKMGNVRKQRKDFIAGCQKIQLLRRQLMLAYAVRAYELEHGKRPASLADLVPAYLKAIPKDPVTGKNLAYSP